ncbi:hypothetical protein AB4Y38_35405 [Paraburkholderia sp. EG285A]|uniref:hypothetical protein n=1 Tax=Paraburkholderia sp. EG285A TaxID=3237009 RepID=UPI0034D25307
MTDSFNENANGRALARKERLYIVTEEGQTVRRYRLVNLGYSSERYGVCEVCAEHVSEVHYQTHERLFMDRHATPDHPHRFGWTNVSGTFGHRTCLERARKGDTQLPVQPEVEHAAHAWPARIAAKPVTVRCAPDGFSVWADGELIAHAPQLASTIAAAHAALQGAK